MRTIALWCLLCAVAWAQPPKVVVDVAIDGNQAKQDDKPLLPDDFGQASRSVQYTMSQPDTAVATLYTADGNWCAPCKQQEQILRDGNVPKELYRVVKLGREDFAAYPQVSSVPTWVPDDGSTAYVGPRTADGLTAWLTALRQRSAAKSPDNRTFHVDGEDTKDIFLALEEIARQTQDGAPQATQGWIPTVPVDIDDSLLKILDSLLSSDGYTAGGVKLSWGTGKRSITFDPGMQVRFKKYVEVDLVVERIDVDGRLVTLTLDGTIVNTLTVRLK